MAESKQKKKLLLKKKLADDIESSKLINEFNNRNARQTMKKLTNITKNKVIQQPNSSNNNTQSSFQKKEVQQKDEDTLSLQIEEPMLAEVAGPQLKVNKYHMSFVEKTGNVAKDSIIVTNNGTTAIYYKWKRIDVNPFFKTSILDQEERFFCHANKSIIKPGEMKVFHFTFKSRATGIFEEEWNLECEPPLVQPLSTIKLSGHAIQDDPNVEWRSEIDSMIEHQHRIRFAEEIVEDVFRNVRTPTPPLPDLEDPVVWKKEFEEKNAKHHLYFTPLIMNWLKELQRLIYAELDIGIYEPEHHWDLSMDYLRDKINSIKSQSEYENLLRRYDDLYKIAKIRPLDRSNIYHKCRKILEGVFTEFEDISNSIRREKDLLERTFTEPQDLTEEEIKKKKDEEAKAKAELLKKTKKKPRTEDDEKKVIEEYRKEFVSKVEARMCEKLDYIEKNEVAIRAQQELQIRKRPDRYFYEMLALKRNFKDLDQNIEGRRVLIRIHLKRKNLAQFQAEWDADVRAKEAEAKAAEEAAKNAKKDAKKPVKKTKEELAEEARKLKEDTERRKFVMGIEESSLQQAISIIKYFLEQLAKLVLVYASFGDSHGVPNPETSLKYFYEYLKTKMEQPCYWEGSTYIPDMAERQETEYAENSCIVFENCYHEPRELGYSLNENGVLTKLDYADVDDYAAKLSEYAGYFVIEDKDLLFKNHTSISKIKPQEAAFFGRCMTPDINLLSQALLHANYEPKLSKRRKRERERLPKIQKKKSVFLMAGEYFPECFLAIDTALGCYDKICLAGKIGILFFMFVNKVDKMGDFAIDEVQKACMAKLFDNAKELSKEIVIPSKFIITTKPAAKEGTSEWVQAIVASEKVLWPIIEVLKSEPDKITIEEEKKVEEPKKDPKTEGKDGKKKDSKPPTAKVERKDDKKEPPKDKKGQPIEEKPAEIVNPFELDPHKVILGYDHDYITQLMNLIHDSRSLFWVGSLDPIVSVETNEFNKTIAWSLFVKYEERKRNLVAHPTEITNDWLVSCIGEDLLQALGYLEFIPDFSKSGADATRLNSGEITSVPKLENSQSKISGLDVEEEAEDAESVAPVKEKSTTVNLICDAHSPNTQFILKILQGYYVEGIDTISTFDRKNEDSDAEDFSFLDEI